MGTAAAQRKGQRALKCSCDDLALLIHVCDSPKLGFSTGQGAQQSMVSAIQRILEQKAWEIESSSGVFRKGSPETLSI
jgi:hypothetical protein